eukprot:239182-Rhodomonas_salina.1
MLLACSVCPFSLPRSFISHAPTSFLPFHPLLRKDNRRTSSHDTIFSRQGCGACSLVRCTCARLRVFGRMTPKQKVQVVRHFANAGLTVGMCGDGGNDSGALRAAHAGLALSGRAGSSLPLSSSSSRSPAA